MVQGYQQNSELSRGICEIRRPFDLVMGSWLVGERSKRLEALASYAPCARGVAGWLAEFVARTKLTHVGPG